MFYQDDRICLDIADNGIGFDSERFLVEGTIDSGFGLYSMKERARILGGDFNIESESGVGTRVVACFPAEQIR